MHRNKEVVFMSHTIKIDWPVSPWSHVGHPLRRIFMLWLVKIWQGSSCGKFMQYLETCLLTAEADRVCVILWWFSLPFSTGCAKWNTAAFKILLLFMAGLLIEFLVEKCAVCRSHRKSDFGLIALTHFPDSGLTWWPSGTASRLVSLSNFCIWCFFFLVS